LRNVRAVELLDQRIRFRADGQEPVRAAIQGEYPQHGPFDEVGDALYFLDNLYVLDRNDAEDIVQLERESFDGNDWAGSQVWDLLAPWLDAGDFLEYLDTEDNDHFRVTFDGAGSYTVARPTFV
jgi:hypothetical protein